MELAMVGGKYLVRHRCTREWKLGSLQPACQWPTENNSEKNLTRRFWRAVSVFGPTDLLVQCWRIAAACAKLSVGAPGLMLQADFVGWRLANVAQGLVCVIIFIGCLGVKSDWNGGWWSRLRSEGERHGGRATLRDHTPAERGKVKDILCWGVSISPTLTIVGSPQTHRTNIDGLAPFPMAVAETDMSS